MVAKGSKLNSYTPEFSDEAVKYWRSSGKSVPACAAPLDIKESTLSAWVTLANRAQKQDSGPKSFEESSRLRELEKQNTQLKAENAFLKKANTYFASIQK